VHLGRRRGCRQALQLRVAAAADDLWYAVAAIGDGLVQMFGLLPLAS
jgi:hypothetical protein